MDIVATYKNSDDAFISEHADLVAAIAWKMHKTLSAGAGLELSDLVQSGMMGLHRARLGYRSDKGASFKTYASIRIVGEITDTMRTTDSATRGLRREIREMHQVIESLGPHSTNEQVAKEFGCSAERVVDIKIAYAALNPLSLDAPIGESESDNDAFIDTIASTVLTPDQNAANDAIYDKALATIDKMPERTQRVLSMYWDGDMSLKEIGAELGLTQSRVCQLHQMAIDELTHKEETAA